MKYSIRIIILFLLITVKLSAIDSLFNQPEFGEYQDTLKIKLLYKEAIRYFRSNNDYSKTLLFKAEQIALNTHSTKLGEIYKALAYSYITSGQSQAALEYLNRSEIEYSNINDNFSLSFLSSMRAQIYRDENILDSSIFYYNKSESYLSRYKGEDRMIVNGYYASLYTNIGNLYFFNIQDISQAKVYYDSALYYAKINNDTLHLTASYSNIGIVYIKKKKYKEAKEYLEKAYELSLIIAHEEYAANIMTNLGDMYHRSGNLEMSIYCKIQSLEISKKLNNHSQIFTAKRLLAKAYQHIKEYDKSMSIYYTLLSDTANINLSQKSDLMLNFSSIHEELQQHDSSLYYFKKHSAISKKIVQLNNFKATGELIISHNTEQTKMENLVLKKQNKAQKKYGFLSLGFSFILILVVVLLILFNRQRKRYHAKKQQVAQSENALLKEKLEFKSKELTINTMNMIRHSEFVSSLIPDLRKLSQLDTVNRKQTMLQIIQKINLHNRTHLWEDFNKTFTEVNNSFYDSLNKKHTNLTPKERKLAALLKLDLSTKDIASITHMSIRGVESARHRMRIKLELTSEVNLSNYLQNF
ncbi:MAG: tetratricopeptide repeat protein [Bacteroidales bacterium]|nr:tetratricopeptide repeat protein [Bacteroidales bacterium]